ncbi:hypothetical protein [Saccharothrix syringae]|uniref:hypothetical protein n=1 Tax=Saccharothrix syringae TaxID=103733 RepID=UPI000B0A6962|nr:hypothetical protein [Saccharothrix syringae]
MADHGPTARVPGSRTVRCDGPGHGLFAAMADPCVPCVIEHAGRYVTTRELPPVNTTCE